MTPVLMEGDVVSWTPSRIEDVKVGDIIVFKSYISWPDEKIVVHRVSDIKTNSKNQILLETKGDKNTWTDQAGPHIPEPYIRENHLMGKIISLGNVPLKIPFVGAVGIWINNGLEQLSQPTVEKETISFIGIFAPLTISLVVLVVLIFILPERAKTIKEKIRYYIFGKKPLNLKKTAITFLIAYIVFFSIIHVFANDQVTSAVGINSQTEDAGIKFGNIKPGSSSGQRFLPVYNPGTMNMKGVVYGTGELNNFVTRKNFEIEKGESKFLELKAIAKNNSKNGSYMGNIMVFSSPFWTMFPDEFIKGVLDFNAEASVIILDCSTALILTGLTLLLLIAITFISEKSNELLIDRSWIHPSRFIIKKRVTKKIRKTGRNAKKALNKSMGWILNINYESLEEDKKFLSKYFKSFAASIVILPVLFYIKNPITAMFISVLIGGILSYFVSCKVRKKIVLTVFIIMTITTIHMLIQSNIIILEKEITTLEMLSLSVGIIGVYVLIFTLLLIPISAVVWYITHVIRNVKEQKDPLLSLEGRCDL